MRPRLLPVLLLLAAVAALPAAELPRQFNGATPLEWAQRMARSEMERAGTSYFHGGTNPRARWDYTTSLVGLSLVQLGAETGDRSFTEYGARTVESFVADDGTIRTYKMEDYNIDMIPPGKVMLLRWEQGVRDEKFRRAIGTMLEQMEKHPRTTEGGFWHKLRYPHQMWLDGLFMASPFLAHYAKIHERPELFDDVAKQILLMDRHAYDAAKGLHYHAWDEKRLQPWANKETGWSPNFWSRAIGWYGMALVDSLDFFSPTHPEVDHINEVLRRVADGIVRWQDPATGLWWQVTDQGNRPGNYLEGTASAMFTYILAKGINRGYLPREKYLPALLKGYTALIRDLVRVDPDGKVNLTRCCSVAGLGFTNSAGRVRDGSFDYYISEPIIDNDLKGVGPFILGGIEMQRLVSGSTAARPVRGWEDYPAVLARIQAPKFPDRDFPITEFGAKPDGSEVTAAIARAIDAAHAAGGGRVVVPPGEWPTGALHAEEQRQPPRLQGRDPATSSSPIRAHYPIVFTRWEGVELMELSPLIYAYRRKTSPSPARAPSMATRPTWENTGGPGTTRPPRRASARTKQRRPRPPIRSGRTDVRSKSASSAPAISSARTSSSPTAAATCSSKASPSTARRCGTSTRPLAKRHRARRQRSPPTARNNDGCNPESSSDVLIEDCLFDTGDDCIAIKSGRNADGRRLADPLGKHRRAQLRA
jgi:unsaturated rhamnogalacturonyl hydrolase